MSSLWTVARNASGRPTLQHAVDPREPDVLVCDPNFIIVGWSRSYSSVPIASIACKKCLTRNRRDRQPDHIAPDPPAERGLMCNVCGHRAESHWYDPKDPLRPICVRCPGARCRLRELVSPEEI